MRNYVGAGWASLIVGSVSLGYFLAVDLSIACIYPPTPSGFPDMRAPITRCGLLYTHLPIIIINIAMVVAGIVLRSLGRKKEKKIS